MSTGKKLILFLIAIFGALIAYLSYSYLSVQKTNIYLFKADYESGTKISKDMFVPLEVDASMVTDLAYATQGSMDAKYVTANDLSLIIENGDYLGTDAFKGTPFMTTQTATIGGSTVERRLSDYKTAITIPVNNISGVSPEINAGARINIYASYSTESFQVEELLFQNVKILDVQATGNKEDGYVLSAFTIEVDPQDAMKLLHAINNWKIDITLLKSGAYEIMTTSSIFKVNTLMLDAIIGSQGTNPSVSHTVTQTTTSNVSSGNESNVVEETQVQNEMPTEEVNQ